MFKALILLFHLLILFLFSSVLQITDSEFLLLTSIFFSDQEEGATVLCMEISLFGICFLKSNYTEATSLGSLEEEIEGNMTRKYLF
jgi:hypothetical protein